MKRMLANKLSLVVVITMIFVLIVNLVLQIENAQVHTEKSAHMMIDQMEESIDSDNRDNIRYVLSGLAAQEGVVCFVVDTEGGEILASTESAFEGKNTSEIKLIFPENPEKIFYAKIAGTPTYNVFRIYHDLLIGVACERSIVFQQLPRSMLLVLLYLTVASIVMIAAILRSIDDLVINNINTVNEKLSEITRGNLDTKVQVNTLPEFVSLSTHINQMTDALLNTNIKISRILDATDAQIGFFEYSKENGKVLVTRKFGTILMISPEEMKDLIADRQRFEAKLTEICTQPVPRCKNIYSLPTETACYVKLEKFSDTNNTFGIVMDVTEEIVEKEQLRHERDHDLLTQLNGRRAFYRGMEELFSAPEKLGCAVMMMFDLDGLKTINDTCGHAGGDKAIREAANILNRIPSNNKLVARLSGDEFAVFLYGGSSREDLQRHIDALYQDMLRAEVTVFDHVVPVRLSGGYVFCTEDSWNYTKLLRMADQALYHSKNMGKARFSVYCEELESMDV